MNQDEQLLGLLAWTHDEQNRWLAGLSAAEREAAGRADAWAARDLLAHFAEWSAVLREVLVATAEGREPPTLPDDDEINQLFFERNRDLSWAEVAGKAQAAYEALAAQLRTMPAEVLAAPSQPGGQPTRLGIVFSHVDHTLRHMSENLMARGERDVADALMVEGARRMAAMDDSTQFRGAIVYNLACHLTLNGRTDRALDTLREALTIRPDLAEYATQDGDFAGLRDDPDFQALVQE
jgi:hypothetical protein